MSKVNYTATNICCNVCTCILYLIYFYYTHHTTAKLAPAVIVNVTPLAIVKGPAATPFVFAATVTLVFHSCSCTLIILPSAVPVSPRNDPTPAAPVIIAAVIEFAGGTTVCKALPI